MAAELPASSPARYRAFISYSHADERTAARLHRRLESYRLPPNLRQAPGHVVRYPLRPVFRDRDELATSSSLGEAILAALRESAVLVVICSPKAVTSRWVNEEIRTFRKLHPDRPVFAFVARGEPGDDPRTKPASAALPLMLLLQDVDQPDGPLGEPLAADARSAGDGFNLAFLKLAAGLLGVPFDQLRRREARRRQRQRAVALGTSVALMTVFAVLAWRATVARNEAQAARAQAELELLSERETRNFLLSVFKLADPSEARGQNVTVREVLDRAVLRIDSTPFSRPVIKSRFLATMGQAYSSLGLNRRGVELLEQSIAALPAGSVQPEDLQQEIDSRIELADIHFDMGDYAAALAALNALPKPRLSALQRAQASNIQGDVLAYQQQDAQALEAYQLALEQLAEADVSAAEVAASVKGRSLGGMALLSLFAGDADRAQQLYGEVIDILVPAFGEAHPDSIWAMISWGSAAYANNDPEVARDAWERVLRTAERVLGTANTEVATIKSNLGRLELESGNYLVAESLLADALRIDREHRVEDFDDLSFTLFNLALARWALDQLAEASALLEEGARIAGSAGHRMLGPILIARAELACAAGDPERGLELVNDGLEQVRQHHGETDWRYDQGLLVQAYCRSLLDDSVADDSARGAACRLLERWPDPGWFNQQALRLGAALQLNADSGNCDY